MVGSYNFGQFRANQLSNYIKSIEHTLTDKKVESSLSKGNFFIDKAIELSGSNQLQGTDAQGKMRCFYLCFKVHKQPEIQNINVILKNTTLLKDNSQTLGTIQIEAGDESEYSTFDFIFSPNENRTFNEIHFELQRTATQDLNIQNPDGTFGRKINLEIVKLAEINNVIDTLNPSIANRGKLKQIGIQTAPGLIICINGEQIKVGRSGLYEIKNGVEINFIGFIVENNDKYFILDYQY